MQAELNKLFDPASQACLPAESSSVHGQKLAFTSVEHVQMLCVKLWHHSALSFYRYEAGIEGEFAGGTSQQWGEADIDGEPEGELACKDFSNQDLRRSNFTSASAKKANFSNSNFSGAYFIKAVLAEILHGL
eukprot:scaffold190872_cov21-Tisochrysis_lutea.AAC.1